MSLEAITGPMFSGKTEELIRRLHRHVIAKRRVVLIKPQIDQRWDLDKVKSHNGATMDCEVASSVSDVLRLSIEKDVIGIDEVQFFSVDIVKELCWLSEKSVVIAAGLDLTFAVEPWPVTSALMSYADKVDKLAAICIICGNDATRSQRLIDGKPAEFTGPEVLIGGKESYEARCQECFVAA